MVSLLARLGLAAVWLVSGWLKVIDPAQTRIAVEAYRLLPDGMVDTVAVVPASDGGTGQRPVAFATLRDGAAVDAPALEAIAADHLTRDRLPVEDEEMVALSRPKLPQAGLGQRIASIALLLLALIAAIALLSRGSDDGRSSGPAPSPFTAQSYGSDTSVSGGSDGSSSSPSSSQARSMDRSYSSVLTVSPTRRRA